MNKILSEIQSDIEALRDDNSLEDEFNFVLRQEAIDAIDFHVIHRIETLNSKIHSSEECAELKRMAIKLKSRLVQADVQLFENFRTKIRTGTFTGIELKKELLIRAFSQPGKDLEYNEPGYDNLDILVNGIFSNTDLPDETQIREPEMVYFQKTPAKIVFELAGKLNNVENEVFYDLGSGLGQVCILMNLLTGIPAKGIEFDPGFCDYARQCAACFNLPKVEFMNEDVRTANFADGTVFFMYTPVTGSIMATLMHVMKLQALQKPIRIFTYGPCTPVVAKESWLICTDGDPNDMYRLAEFSSMSL